MAEPALVYAFEGVSADLPRPPLSAMRALLSAGVVVSARAWQELPPETRVSIARVGQAEQMDEAHLSLLLKQVHVSQIKFIGRRGEPDGSAVPAELATALGPVRPLTLPEWTGLRALDRYVLVSLVKNSRLLAKALNEMLPQTGGAVTSNGVVVAWSGLVARCEIRMRREAVQKAMSPEFMGGRAFVLANVAGRRAARRSSELFDLQAESTVGPVEVDWGLRAADDVLFWQAHVSAWDGTFFPVAAMLAATTAATAMYDIVRALDPNASVIFAGVREEPWQAGRDHLIEPATSLFQKPTSIPPRREDAPREDLKETARVDPNQETLRDAAPRASRPSFPDIQRGAPAAPTSSPVLVSDTTRPLFSMPLQSPLPPRVGPGASLPPSPSQAAPPSSGRSDGAHSSKAGALEKPPRPAWVGVAVVGVVVLANLLVIFGIAVYLSSVRR